MNSNELNSIANITDALSLFLVHDSDGTIVKILHRDGTAFNQFYETIVNGGTLKPYFDITRLKHEVSEERIICPGKYIGRYDLYYGNFILNATIHNLVSSRFGKDLFIGKVTIMEIMPTILSSDIHGFFFSHTENDTLEGVETSFMKLMTGKENTGKEILGIPMNRYLTPSPLEYQRQNIHYENTKNHKGFEEIYAYKRAGTDLKIEHSANISVIDETGGLFIRNSSNDLAFIRVGNGEINGNDYILVFNVAAGEGSAPLVTISDEGIAVGNRYMLGTHAGSSRLFIKRFGVNAAIKNLARVAMAGTYTMSKFGRSLHYEIPGEERISYFDNEFIDIKKPYFAIVIRPGTAITIKSISLFARTTPDSVLQGETHQYIASLRSNPDSHFIISRFYNNALSSNPDLNLAGYLPLDISHIQNRVDTLDKYFTEAKRETTKLKSILKKYQNNTFESLLGESAAIKKLRETALVVAKSNATVLIEGATGAGKEVLARYIHANSSRKTKAFTKVDCSTIPGSLMESQLFGHEKGAFTGAVSAHKGFFEEADGGTLFIDEAGNLPMASQMKLLQFFNDFTITKVGSVKPVKVDARCILASNENLLDKVKAGTFREDLYFRIQVICLQIPPLSDHPDDIPLLADHFLQDATDANGRPIKSIHRDAYKKLCAHTWPGNIRELRNVIHRAVVFCEGNIIMERDIDFEETSNFSAGVAKFKKRIRNRLIKTDNEIIISTLRKHDGNVRETAQEMGVGRVTLYLHLKKLGIKPSDYMTGYVP